MAMVIPFDTLAFAKELETAGVPAAQAEAQAKILVSIFQKVEENRRLEFATKPEIEELKKEREGLAIKGDIKELETRLKGDIKELDAKLEARIIEVKRDIKELELRMTAEIAPLKWGIAVSVSGIIALLLKGFLPH